MPLPVRSVPPWVRDCEEDDLVPSPLPVHAYNAQTQQHSRWYSFASGAAYPHERPTAAIISPSELEKSLPDQNGPWRGNRQRTSSSTIDAYQPLQKRKKTLYQRGSYIMLRNPFIPLVLRLIILIFAIAALALGASIHEIANQGGSLPTDQRVHLTHGPSSLMAIIIDAIAIPYILGVTWDEYTGKPLGLRSAGAKLRIVLLDLFFIVFESANLALAFQSLSQSDQGCGRSDGDLRVPRLCERAGGLSAVLLVALVAWLATFSVSLLRLVERVAQR